MTISAVEIKNLSVSLGNHPVIQDLSVNLPSGQIIGCIGPSGSGKTTLIRAIVGRQKLSAGSIKVLGMSAGSAPLRHQVSYMTQETSVYLDLSVTENLTYFATMCGISHISQKNEVNRLLKLVDLEPQRNQIVSSLSGGQKQRVSLAIALIGKPKLIVLDEPTVGLDPVLRIKLWDLFRELADSGTTLIVSSHVMDEAEHCDDIILLRDGRLLAHNSPKALCANTKSKTVEESFLKLVGEKV